MRAFFSGRGQSQLAGYAGTAGGVLRSRIHPLMPIAAIDLFAIVVGLGALTLVGTIVSGQHGTMFLLANDRTKDDFTSFAVSAVSALPMAMDPVLSKAAVKSAASELRSRRIARQPAGPLLVWAAMPSEEVLFGQPVLIGGPFESNNNGDTVRFVCPLNTGHPPHCGIWPPVAEESPPTNDVAVIEDRALPFQENGPKSHSGAERTQTTTATASAPATQIVAAAPVAAPAAVQSVAAPVAKAAAPVAQVAAPVVQAATPVVHAAAPVVQAAAAPVRAVAAPAQKVAAPVVQATAPVARAAVPVAQATAPVVQAAAPVAQAAAAPVQLVQSVTQSVTGGIAGLLN